MLRLRDTTGEMVAGLLALLSVLQAGGACVAGPTTPRTEQCVPGGVAGVSNGRPEAALAVPSIASQHNDVQGTARLVTDDTGLTIGTTELFPFGQLKSSTGTMNQTSWAYAGHERVDGFQLSDFGRRSYHGRAVAFVTPDRDRLGDVDDPASFNRYAYARGNPETLVDPDGRTPVAAVLPAAPAAAPVAVGFGVAAHVQLVQADVAATRSILADPTAPRWYKAAAIVNTAAGAVSPAAGVVALQEYARQRLELGTWMAMATGGPADVTKRPSGFRKQTLKDAWDEAADGSMPGNKACPDCGGDLEVAPGAGPRDWHGDHQPKWKDRDLSGKTREEVLDEYNKGVRARCPSCNVKDNQ